MIDLIEILGEENLLVGMIIDQSKIFNGSLQYDAKKLAEKAGITNYHFQSTIESFSYRGKAFCLKFQSNLPEGHEHYWRAEILIGGTVGEENSGTILDDEVIPIFVYGNKNMPISDGNLNLLGISLVVCAGKSSCTLGDLRNNLSKNKVFFSAPGYGIVHGHLTF